MIKTLIKWALYAAALLAVSYLYPGVAVASFTAALVAALVIGLLNAIVRPVLRFLTFPITILTLGLFLFVINAGIFWGASELLSGFHVTGFMAALIGSVLYSALALIIDKVVEGVAGSSDKD